MMIDLTISLTYYGQVEKLITHCDFFSNLDEIVKNRITVQMINDGFNDQNIFTDTLKLYKDSFNLKGYVVKQDIGFNNHGCRNLAMLQSQTHWNWLIDIDAYPEPDLIEAILTTPLKDEQFYVFEVYFDHIDNPEDYDLYDPKKILKWIAHPNIWLITKPCFWSSGGYDMEFAGMRHGDQEFFESINKDKYDHFLFHPELEKKHKLFINSPNRTKSYLNQITEHVGYLNKCVDFVEKRNDNKDRKFKKRLICFDWERVV